MTTELRTRMILDLEGGYAATVKAWDKATQKFLTGTHASLGVAQRAWSVFGGKIDGAGNNFYARVVGAGGLALAARSVASFDESLTRIGINANASADQVAKLKQQIMDVANRPDIKVKIDDLADGVAGIVERTGDLKFASANIENLGHVMQATGEDAESVGELMGAIRTFGVESPKEILGVMDAWTEMGKKSGLSLKEMVKDGGQVLNVYQGLGRTGPQALKEVGAVLNSLAESTGRPRTAMAQVAMMLEQFQNPQARPFLNLTGVEDLQGRLKVPLAEAMKRIVEHVHGSQFELERMFGQTSGGQVFAPLMAEYQTGKPLDALDKYLHVTADGTGVIDDSRRAADEAAESVNTLTNAWEKFENKDLSKPLKEIGDELDKTNPETMQKWLKGAEYTAGGLLAIYGARKLWSGIGSAIRTGKYIFGGGKGVGSKLGGLTEMAGATPVYVVNMPGSGIAGAGGLGGTAAEAEASAPMWARIGGWLVKGAILYGTYQGAHKVGNYAYEHWMSGNSSGDFFGKSMAAMWGFLGSDTARDAVFDRSRAEDVVARGRAGIYQTLQHESNINLKLSFDANGIPVLKGATSDSGKLNLVTAGGFARFQF